MAIEIVTPIIHRANRRPAHVRIPRRVRQQLESLSVHDLMALNAKAQALLDAAMKQPAPPALGK